jgi:hypothetical protein
MKQAVGRVLANPVIRKAVITAVSNVIYLYAKAFINVVTKKLDGFASEKEELKED